MFLLKRTAPLIRPRALVLTATLRAVPLKPTSAPLIPLRKLAMLSRTHDVDSLGHTSGTKMPVWLATDPYKNFETFPKLESDISQTDVCIVGGGIAGISLAYELLQREKSVTLIEARDFLSGESGRTSGHLASALDDHYHELIATFGEKGARTAYDSHSWALHRIGKIAEAEGIECEYRTHPGKLIVSVPKSDPGYKTANDLPKEVEALRKLGIPHTYNENAKIGAAYEGAVIEYADQATFHPTKYLNGLLAVLRKKHSKAFRAFSNTRMSGHMYKDHGTHVKITTEGGHSIIASAMAMTTNVPLQEASVIIKEAYYRTYCVAVAAPKGTFPDISLYDNSDPYIYVRKTTHPDPEKEYIITGGEDHKVGQESPEGYRSHFQRLVKWTKAHYPACEDKADYEWSGQIIEPNDYLAFIGRNTGLEKNVYIATGDSGNGLTHGVIAGRLIADLINGTENPKWARLYSPSRLPKPRTVPTSMKENINQNVQFKRYAAVDVSDIEDIPKCEGAVMHGAWKDLKVPVAVYKDEKGEVRKFSAVCPHMKGIVAWNSVEKTWDCGVHGSRFEGKTGRCVMGPSNRGLKSKDEAAAEAQQAQAGTSEEVVDLNIFM